MSNILSQKDPPFIFALLLVAFSWAISHVVTRTIEKPIIEVQSSIATLIPKDIISCSGGTIDSKNGAEVHTFMLTNISKDRLFKNLSFLATTTGGKIHGVRIRALSPAVPGDTPEACSDKHGSFVNVTLHPGWQLQIDVVTNTKADLALRLSSAKEAVNLTECNIETWLVRNESLVLVCFLIIISILAAAYLFHIAQNPQKQAPQAAGEHSEEVPQ